MESLPTALRRMAPLGVVLLLLALVSTFLVGVLGHGRLMDPPARNAMWRFGYPNPVNYNDNELYCGGFVVHYQKNKGKCGVCGDNYVKEPPRPHEAGGIYGNGVVTRRYVSGQVINIEAELTTNHWGYMEIRLCPHNDPYTEVTQACLDHYLLPLTETGETRFVIPKDSGKSAVFQWTVKLPDGITCTNCVMQWKYFTGNTWGLDDSGSGAVGYGPQETFINCADVSININAPTGSFPAEALQDNPWQLFFRGNFPGMQKDKNSKPGPDGLTALVVRAQVCLPVSHHKRHSHMNDWCKSNCLKYPPNCDVRYCRCVSSCEAVGALRQYPDADRYCHQECLRNPPNCSETLCRCS